MPPPFSDQQEKAFVTEPSHCAKGVKRILRSKRKIVNVFSEPAILAAMQQMKFKRSGKELVIYELKRRLWSRRRHIILDGVSGFMET